MNHFMTDLKNEVIMKTFCIYTSHAHFCLNEAQDDITRFQIKEITYVCSLAFPYILSHTGVECTLRFIILVEIKQQSISQSPGSREQTLMFTQHHKTRQAVTPIGVNFYWHLSDVTFTDTTMTFFQKKMNFHFWNVWFLSTNPMDFTPEEKHYSSRQN